MAHDKTRPRRRALIQYQLLLFGVGTLVACAATYIHAQFSDVPAGHLRHLDTVADSADAS